MFLHEDFLDAISLMYNSAHRGNIVELLRTLDRLAMIGYKLQLMESPISNVTYLQLTKGDKHQLIPLLGPYNDVGAIAISRAISNSCLL
ncbi:hypothetical protein VL73_53 [Erwinia phage VL73]